MADVRCSNCDALNPGGAVRCWNCRQNLASGEAGAQDPAWLEGLREESSAPESSWEPDAETPPAGEPEEETPDWLSRIRERSQSELETEPSAPVGAGGTGAEPAEELPDWLKDMSGPAEDDWLQAPDESAPPEQTGASAPTEEPAEEEDWLKNLQSWQETQRPGEPQEPAAESPFSWQQPDEPQEPAAESPFTWQPTGAETLPEEASAGEEQAEEEEGLSWLSQLSAEDTTVPTAEPPSEPEDAGEEQAEEEGLSWLSQLTAEKPAAPTAGAPSEPESAIPDWLETGAGEETLAEAAAFEPEQPAGPNEEDEALPSWLFAGSEDLESAVPPAEAQPPAGEEAQLPFAEAGPPAGQEETQTPPADVPAAPFAPFLADDLPAWLTQESVELPPEEPPEDKPAFIFDEKGEFAEPVLPEDHPFAAEEMPEWLDGRVAEEAGAQAPQEGEGEIAPGQLPGWLEAMRPVEAVAPDAAALPDDTHTEKSGPLAGIQGILPPEGFSAQYRKPPVYSIRLHISDKQRAHAAILEETLSEEGKPAEMHPERTGVPQLLVRLLIALLLIALLLFSGALNRTEPLGGEPSFGYVGFRSQVSALAEGGTVLVAFEYNPAYSAEMRLAAGGVLQQLLAGGAKIATISTVPTGPVLAEDLSGRAAESAGITAKDERLVNLGYLAGGVLSLQEFAAHPQETTRYQFDTAATGRRAWEQPPLQGIQALDDFSLAIVLTDSPEIGRAWVEQVAPSFGDTPLLMIASAQAAPLLQPYVASGQVDGMIAGLLGGSYFAVPGQPGVEAGYRNAFHMGVRAAIALIVLGILIQGIRSLFTSSKA